MQSHHIQGAHYPCLLKLHFVKIVKYGTLNLQTLLLKFDQMAESLNMVISLNKTKSLTISRNYAKCEVKLKDTMIEQVTKFNYLGVELSAKRDLKQEVRIQATKAARISGCLYNLVWLNK